MTIAIWEMEKARQAIDVAVNQARRAKWEMAQSDMVSARLALAEAMEFGKQALMHMDLWSESRREGK